jgi:hypothetical protein
MMRKFPGNFLGFLNFHDEILILNCKLNIQFYSLFCVYNAIFLQCAQKSIIINMADEDSDTEDDMRGLSSYAMECQVCQGNAFSEVDGLAICDQCGAVIEGYSQFVDDQTIGYRRAALLRSDDDRSQALKCKSI